MKRLSEATLADLPAAVKRPSYAPGDIGIGIVHLGLGAFHRAHQAVYVDDCLVRGETGWGIAGVSLRSPDTRDALTPQDGLYTVLARDGAGTAARVVGSLRETLFGPDDMERVLSLMAAAAVRIVTLTVTEKGYCHDPASGVLDETHPDIRRDLTAPWAPRTVPGLIVEALRRRRAAGLAPFTAVSCDNLPGNGTLLRRIVTRHAALLDPDLAHWISDEAAFPSTMVDRIVPAAIDADRNAAADLLGVEDRAPVVAEPFSQWVIEDDFAAGRPALDAAGAQLVGDVAPFETAKLRLLNGLHSFFAYLGRLAGFETMAEVVADPDFLEAGRRFLDETGATVSLPGGGLDAYKQTILRRFANPALRHRTSQIAMDGSQKLPQRLVAPIRERLARGAPLEWLALGLAGWMRYALGLDDRGQRFEVRDPLADRFAAIVDAVGLDPARLTRSFLSIEAVFGSDLRDNSGLTDTVSRDLEILLSRGARATLRERTHR